MNQSSTPSRVSRSGLLLTETLIAILFFSIASAVCLQLFGKADILNKKAHLLNMAATQTSSVADLLSTSPLPEANAGAVCSVLADYYPLAQADADAVFLYYDKEFHLCEKENANYLLSVCPSDSGVLINYSLEMYLLDPDDTDSEIVYQMDVSVYRPYDKSNLTADAAGQKKEAE